jgi:hypothetical protein
MEISTRRKANGMISGLLVCLGFGALWLLMALGFWPARPFWSEPAVLAAAVLLGGWIFVRAPSIQRIAQYDTKPPRAYTGAIFAAVVALECIAILAAVNILIALHHEDLQTFAIAAVVGLHFLPLAWLFRVKSYYWAGAMMVIWTGACLAIENRVSGAIVLGLGMGAILWSVAIQALLRLKR